MKQEYEETPFARAAQSFSAALPKYVEAVDEDLAKIVIPGWRYDEIADAVLAMYEKVDARVMPLPVFDIVNGLGCSLIPYRSYGPRLHEVLIDASKDAFTMQFFGSSKPIIMYNDRRLPVRINYTIMHEVGHIALNHKEHSALAEKEANYFAGLALCPLDLLEHYGIDSAQKITQLFNVSGEFAENRLKAMANRRHRMITDCDVKFRDAVVSRFHFKDAYQMDLFANARKGVKESA